MRFPWQSLGIGFAHSVIFFIHAATFGYGGYLVQHGEMKFQNVFRSALIRTKETITLGCSRIFAVITFSAMSVGR